MITQILSYNELKRSRVFVFLKDWATVYAGLCCFWVLAILGYSFAAWSNPIIWFEGDLLAVTFMLARAMVIISIFIALISNKKSWVAENSPKLTQTGVSK